MEVFTEESCSFLAFPAKIHKLEHCGVAKDAWLQPKRRSD
jgi:hypothetical protein